MEHILVNHLLSEKYLTEKKQLEIIEGLISQLLWLIAVLGCHNIAHPAADSTYRLVSKDYYWRGMKEHIFSYVSSCKSCQLSTPPIKKGTPKLRPVKPPKEFGVWLELIYRGHFLKPLKEINIFAL